MILSKLSTSLRVGGLARACSPRPTICVFRLSQLRMASSSRKDVKEELAERLGLTNVNFKINLDKKALFHEAARFHWGF